VNVSTSSILERFPQIVQSASVVWWSEFLATDAEVLELIPVTTKFSEKL
jgi:hypothetical protein